MNWNRFFKSYSTFKLTLLLLIASLDSHALEYKNRLEVSTTLQAREFNQKGASRFDQAKDFFLFAALDNSIKLQSFLFEIRPEIRYLESDTNRFGATDGAHIPLSDANRPMKLDKVLVLDSYPNSGTTTRVLGDIEKLNFRYQGETIEFVAGRNPFNPSVLRLSPVWNKFSRDIFYSALPNFQFNPDIASLKYNFKNSSVQLSQVNKNNQLLLVGIISEILESQFLIGKIFDEPSVGFNLTYSSDSALLKLEFLHVENKKFTDDLHNEIGLGFERSWTDSLSTVTEVYASDLSDQFKNPAELNTGVSPFSKLRGKVYLINQIDYQINSDWNSSFQPVLNLEDSSVLALISLRNNLSDNLEVTMSLKLSGGDSWTEFSRQSVLFANGSYIGATNSIYAMLKYFY